MKNWMKKFDLFSPKILRLLALIALLAVSTVAALSGRAADEKAKASGFRLEEATVQSIHAAMKSGQLTSHKLVQMYLDRIDAYDKNGPHLNNIISLNPEALAEADKLDAQFKKTGKLTGSLHGIPIVVKDMADAKGMPTTMGSLALKDYYPERDSFVVEKLRKS